MPQVSSRSFAKYFTVREANAALPLVRRIVEDVVKYYRQAVSAHRKLHDCETLMPSGETEAIEEQRREAADRLHELILELNDIGCELKDWESGLVDFPALRGGEEVFLCWKLGEDKLRHWHDLSAGFTGRLPICDANAWDDA